MKIHEIMEKKKTLSFEVFPPKKGKEDLPKLFKTIDELKELHPDFISVTYGAAGSNSKSNAEIAEYIKKNSSIEPLAHLTGGPSTEEEIDLVCQNLISKGVENILALRGDKPIDYEAEYCKYFKHSTDLEKYLAKYDFSLAAACYPEGHPESDTLYDDLKHMKEKEDLGAKFFITQIFFDNDYYYRLVHEARVMGIKSPIIPGIMPLTSVKSIAKVKQMCGSTLPLGFRNVIEKFKDNKEVMEEIGYNYAAYQIMDLMAKGAPGVHIYTMNNSKHAINIYKRLEHLFHEFF